MKKHRKTFLGVGWKFPPTFDKKTQTVELVSEEKDIKESLYILLNTKKGERVMLPNFGCDLHFLIFETLDSTTINYAKKTIEEAILFYEPRIILNNLDLTINDPNSGVLDINIEYTIRKTNTRTSLVFPYYLIEGTDINT